MTKAKTWKRRITGRKLSSLIRLAIEDCQKIEKNKRYRLNMQVFHSPFNSRICEVCVAGAVIACESGAKPTKEVDPYDFSLSKAGPPSKVTNALEALNEVRQGEFRDALRLLDLPTESDWRLDPALGNALDRAEALVANNMIIGEGRAPWETYLEAAAILQRVGL